MVHEVLQLGLVLLDGLIGPANDGIGILVLQVELTFLGDVTDGEGDEHKLALVVVDGTNAELGVAVDTALDEHALGTEVDGLDLLAEHDVAEGGHLEERV